MDAAIGLPMNDFQILMLMLVAGNVLLTAVCAYTLGLAALRHSNEVFLQRAVKITRRFIVVAGTIYVLVMILWWIMFVIMALN